MHILNSWVMDKRGNRNEHVVAFFAITMVVMYIYFMSDVLTGCDNSSSQRTTKASLANAAPQVFLLVSSSRLIPGGGTGPTK
jgi:hypothetical protein